MAEKFTRGEFLRRFLKPGASSRADKAAETDYLSMLPPEFTDSMLRAETIRLGGDPDKLDKNQMAGMVLTAMPNQTRSDN